MEAKDLQKLRDPFAADDIEWRVQRSGKKGDKIWAMVLAYVTNRAIMDRLDAVCGPENWANEFTSGPGGGILCGLAVRVDGEWVKKWDGADNTDVEAVKGGLSSAMKRTAVQWGIGRYLYNLEAGFANIHDGGKHRDRLKKELGSDAFRWDPPPLPAWALPSRPEPTDKSPARLLPDTGLVDTTFHQAKAICPLCGTDAEVMLSKFPESKWYCKRCGMKFDESIAERVAKQEELPL